MHGRRPIIDYPVRWTFKLIGMEEASVREAVAEVLGDRDHDIAPSHRSRHGTYVSFTLDVIVENEAIRDALFVDLGARPEIRIVL